MSATLPRRVIHGPLVNAAPGALGQKGRKAIVKHLQPGVVRYENEDGTFTTYLLELDGIAAMRPTAAGIPVVGKSGGFDHVKVENGKEYDGIVTDGFWDGESGWESFVVDKMNAETAQACERGFQASCAYIPTETDGKPGLWHNVPYDEKILNGRYTHVAVVPNPRYEGATIELQNSKKESNMNKVLKAALSLFPIKDVKEVLNSMEEDEKKKAADEKAARDNAKAERRAAAQSAYDASMKNASSDEDRQKAKEAFEKANAEIDANPDAAAGGEAGKSDLPKEPLGGGDVTPEPGMPKTEVGKSAANAGETPEQAQEREKKALEAKNAADEAEKKKKEDEEKKNAEDAEAKKKADAEKAKKDEEEKKNAIKKATEEAKIEAARTERFNALRQAAEERGGHSGTAFVGVTTQQEKEDLGRERYGSSR